MRGELRAADMSETMSLLPQFFTSFHPSAELLGEGMRLAVELKHHVYDCLYLALAMHVREQLLTADKGFVVSARRAGLEAHVQLLSWEEH